MRYILIMHTRYVMPRGETNLIYVSETKIDEKYKTILHSHFNSEILYFFGGKGYVTTSNEKVVVKSGDIVIINRGISHMEEKEISGDLEFYAIGIANNVFLQKDEKKDLLLLRGETVGASTVFNIFKEIFEEMKYMQYGFEIMVESYYKILITEMKRLYGISTESVSLPSTTGLIENAKNLIDNYFYANLSVSEIAKSLSVSYSTLVHAFKKETGINVIEYKQKRQIEEAKSLLEITDLRVNQISQNVGFNSCAFFIKTFKKFVKLSPSEYRERLK